METVAPWLVKYEYTIGKLDSNHEAGRRVLSEGTSNLSVEFKRFETTSSSPNIIKVYQKEWIKGNSPKELNDLKYCLDTLYKIELERLQKAYNGDDLLHPELIAVGYESDQSIVVANGYSRLDFMNRIALFPVNKIPDFYQKVPKEFKEFEHRVSLETHGQSILEKREITHKESIEFLKREVRMLKSKKYSNEALELKRKYKEFGFTRLEALFFLDFC